MEEKNWKIVALIFMGLFLIETVLVAMAYNVGTKLVEMEKECMFDTCGDYSSYYFDQSEQNCYCFDNGEVSIVQHIGG